MKSIGSRLRIEIVTKNNTDRFTVSLPIKDQHDITRDFMGVLRARLFLKHSLLIKFYGS